MFCRILNRSKFNAEEIKRTRKTGIACYDSVQNLLPVKISVQKYTEI